MNIRFFSTVLPSERFIRFLFIQITVTVLYVAGPAAENPGSPPPGKDIYNVDGLIEKALNRYEMIKASEETILRYRLEKEQAAVMDNPRLGLEAGMKEASSGGYLYGVSISQTLNLSGRRGLMKKYIAHDEVLAGLHRREMGLFLRYEVMRLAYRYRVQLEKTSHISHRLERLRLIETYLKSRAILSPEKIVESSIVRGRVSILEKEVEETLLARSRIFNELNLLTCFCADDGAFPSIDISWFEKAPVIDREKILKAAGSGNMALLMDRELVKKIQTAGKLESGKRSPDLDISVFYNEEDTGVTERTVGAGVSMPVPLIDRNSDGIKARAREEAAKKLELKFNERSLEQQMRILFAELVTAGRMIEKFPMERLRNIEQSMRYADAEFRKGRVSLPTYLDMDFQSHELIEATYEAQIRLVGVYSRILYNTAEVKTDSEIHNDK